MATIHTSRIRLDWAGSTGAGYRGYDRGHRVTALIAHASATPATGADAPESGAPFVELSADPAFRGDPGRLNPEQLLVAAAASCQLLSFLALAARRGVDVVGYRDVASGDLDLSLQPPRFAGVRLAPVIVLAAGSDADGVADLAREAHLDCFIANSLGVPVTLAVAVEVAQHPDLAGLAPADGGWADVSVELSEPDDLARFTGALGAAGVSLEGGGVFGRTAHYLVADGAAAESALSDAGFAEVDVERPWFARLDQERPGSLAAFTTALAATGRRLRVQYSDHGGRLVLLLDEA